MPDNRREAKARELLGAFASPRNWYPNFDGEGLIYRGPGSRDIAAEKKLPVAVQEALALLDSQQGGVWLSEEEAKQVREALAGLIRYARPVDIQAARVQGGIDVPAALALLDTEQRKAGEER